MNTTDLDYARLNQAQDRARAAARRLGALPEGAPECERHAARRESEQADAAYYALRERV